jgi:hypothetical protein
MDVSTPADSKKMGPTLTEIVFADQEINGRQTLQFVANKYGIPAESLQLIWTSLQTGPVKNSAGYGNSMPLP